LRFVTFEHLCSLRVCVTAHYFFEYAFFASRLSISTAADADAFKSHAKAGGKDSRQEAKDKQNSRVSPSGTMPMGDSNVRGRGSSPSSVETSEAEEEESKDKDKVRKV
jgi:hypothetical protein